MPNKTNDAKRTMIGIETKPVFAGITSNAKPETIPITMLISQTVAQVRPPKRLLDFKFMADLTNKNAKIKRARIVLVQINAKTDFTKTIKPFSKMLVGMYII